MNSENLKIHFIDVMQGDAILIQYEEANYLIDSGKNRSDDKLLNYLQENGVNTIQAILLTHPDYDHLGEFEDLIESESFQIEKFIKNQDTATTLSYGRLMDDLQSYGIPLQIVDYQSDLNWNVETDILSPNYENDFDSANENSIVIKLQFGEISFLLMGDSEEDNNNDLLNQYDMNIDILKVSHHGAVNGTNQAFIDETTPAISILSSGNNSYGHPALSVTQMLLDSDSFVFSTADDYLTHTNGSDDVTADDDILVETDGSSVWVNEELVIAGILDNDIVDLHSGLNLTNYPNPFNPTTGFSFSLAEQSRVSLSIYNIKGQKVKQLVANTFAAGKQSITWNGSDDSGNPVSSGVYYYRLKVNDEYDLIQKCLLLK